MNLFSKGVIFASLAAGFFLPRQSFAQPAKLAITLTVTYQDLTPKSSSNPDVTPSDTKLAKITSANLLTLMSSTIQPFPSDGYLIFDTDLTGGSGAIGETNKGGGFVDVSSDLTITTDASGTGALTSSSTQNPTDPTAQSIVYLSDWVIMFDDGANNTFSISGVIKTTESLAKGNGTVPQTETVTFSGSVTGWGLYMGQNATFTGTISGTGKGPQGS